MKKYVKKQMVLIVQITVCYSPLIQCLTALLLVCAKQHERHHISLPFCWSKRFPYTKVGSKLEEMFVIFVVNIK